MKKNLLLLLTNWIALCSFGQTYSSSAEIYLGLKKLNILGSVLYIAAHPDDENTRLLTYFSKDRLYRTGYLSLTRGDGGQNLIGDEQGIALGLLRTQELLSARRIDGAEQFFTRAFDFGYSKTATETFTKWGKEGILSDVVWVIRKFKPDVIITRFPTTGEGGHGHHTGSAILANEAFAAAADPNRFPEQLKYVSVWQAKRIVWNGFNFGGNAPSGSDVLRLDVGGFNPVLGKSYGEISAESRSQHRSQGFGVARSRGEAFEYFRTTGGTAPVADLFEDVNTGWKKVEGSEAVQKAITEVISTYSFDQPRKSIPGLLRVYQALKKLPDSYWKAQKTKEVKQLIEQTSGLWLEAYTTEPYITQGDSMRINFIVNDRLGLGVDLKSIKVETFDSSFQMTLTPNRNLNFNKTIKVSATTPITQPYWLLAPMKEGYYNVTNQLQIGEPDVDPAFTAVFRVKISDEEIYFYRSVVYKFTHQVRGEQIQPVTVVPEMTVLSNPELLLLNKNKPEKKTLQITGTANRRINYDNITIRTEMDDKTFLSKDSGSVIAKGGIKEYEVTINPKDFPPVPVKAYSAIRFDTGRHNFLALARIRYDHIPDINYFYTDWTRLVPIDLKTYNKKIGYIIGAGDFIPEALEQMGYEVSLLTDKELSRNNLQQFDAIISGVRAFNTNDWMGKHYDKLMRYVANGGNYIVQYSQANNIRSKIGPYNFSLSSRRITDETAAVNFIRPGHPVLNFPNTINPQDFEGWVQERSIYHAANLDSNYQTILRMNDPGEQPDDGSLIITSYGKGYFSYTGLALFRQLPAGVPGAYRLLANLIALNHKKDF